MVDDGGSVPVTKRGLLKSAGAAGLLTAGVYGLADRVWGTDEGRRGMLNAASPPGTTGEHATTGKHDTTTPIEHLIVLFQENVSFDHYFATYPHAKNPDGVPQFHAKPNTPSVEGLDRTLLDDNPNKYDPRRLSRDHALTTDMNHDYTAEQEAFDRGRMDKFVEYTERGPGNFFQYYRDGLVMDYYDGNTVTAMWNYAQHFALNDNSFGTVTGPSTPGALNLVSGQTHGGYAVDKDGNKITDGIDSLAAVDSDGIGTVIGDSDPAWDERGSSPGVAMTGRNIGDLLTDEDVSWGWFQGGFGTDRDALWIHMNVGDMPVRDYSAHHAAFQYYESTANPHHRPPASVDEIGYDGQANHQYDLSYFFTALRRGRLPAVSFLKAARYQDGHAGYSDPLDEQHFLVNTINAIQKSEYWKSTAVVIVYDDSDGWYDHVMPPTVNPSRTQYDVSAGDGTSESRTPLGGYEGRYGYGPRLPLLVISPYSKVNAVDSTRTDQTSVLRFIEDNWNTGRIGNASFDQLAGTIENTFDFEKPRAKRLFLDPKTGQRVHGNTRGPHNSSN